MKNKESLIKRLNKKLNAFVRVYCHEFSLIVHDPGLILFFTFLPFVYPIVYSLIYNPEVVRNVPMIVVDDDRTPLSRELTRNLDATSEIRICGYASDLDEARYAMSIGDCYGILQIPSGFEKKVGRKESAPAVMYSDMSLLLRYRGFLVAATNVMQAMGAQILNEDIDMVAPLATTIATGDLMPIENASLGNIRSGFDSFIMPGVLMLILQQCVILAVAMAGGAKKENYRLSSYDTNMMADSTLSTMIGQALCYCTIMLPAALYIIHYVPLLFKFPMAGNIWEEMIFILPMILASIGVGFCLQGATSERESVFLSWVVTSLLFLFLSGLIWPRYDMPPFWHALSGICPATWGVEGFIKMNANGSSLAQVGPEYTALWILTVGWWIAGWAVQKWIERPAIFRRLAQRRAVTAAINRD